VHQYIDQKKTYKIKWLWGGAAFSLIATVIGYLLVKNSLEIPLEFYVPQKVLLQNETRSVSGLGKIVPREQRFVSAPEDGQVVNIFIRQGQKINKGDPIVKINNFNLIREAKVSSYELAEIQSDVELKKSELGIMRYQLESSLSNAQTERQSQQLTLDANASLVESGIVSKIKFSQEKMSLKQSELEVLSRQKQLELFDKSYEQQIKALDKKVDAGREKKQFFDKRLKSLTLFADVTSTVRNLDFKIGQTVIQGQNLVELIEVENLIAEVQIPQYSVDHVAIGDLTLISTPNGNLNAKVEYVDSVIRDGAATVYLAFDQSLPTWLKIDQSVEVSINTQSARIVSTLNKPNSYEQYDSWTVYRATSKNTIIKTDVALAINAEDRLTLTPVMSEGETVFLLPSQYAKKSSYPIIE
jgi:HlyD family secretion protein